MERRNFKAGEAVEADGYLKFRGRCRKLAAAAVAADPSLRLVRGHYLCPLWGPQAHWWCERPDGTVVDPSVEQFPTKGAGAAYVEFDGTVACEYCGRTFPEEKVYLVGHHAYCSYECYGHDVGF